MSYSPRTRISRDWFHRRAAEFGFRPAEPVDLKTGVEMAEALLGRNIASVDAILAVHAVTESTSWVYGCPVTGLYLPVPLSESGVHAIRSGKFCPAAPEITHLWRPGEDCFGLYVGIYAGQTLKARKAVLDASLALRVEIFGKVPCFARGVTKDGVRSMRRLGFEPVQGNDLTNLYVQEAIVPMQSSAA